MLLLGFGENVLTVANDVLPMGCGITVSAHRVVLREPDEALFQVGLFEGDNIFDFLPFEEGAKGVHESTEFIGTELNIHELAVAFEFAIAFSADVIGHAHGIAVRHPGKGLFI